MSNSKVMKWITGGLELFLAIPLIGGFVVMASAYTVLLVMLVLHIVTLLLSNRDREPIHGSVLGIVTSCVAWIPFLGWLMHLVTGVILLVSAAKRSSSKTDNTFYSS